MRKLSLQEIEEIKSIEGINNRKDHLQNIVIKEWFKSPRGCLEAFTAFGKTHSTLKIIKILNQQQPTSTICIIVPSIDLKNDFVKSINSYQLKNVEVHVVNSFSMKIVKENLHLKYDLLVVDELHTLCNENSTYFSEIIPRVEYKYFIGLSATLEDSHKSYLSKYNLDIFFSISNEDGYRCNLIPDYQIYNIPVQFNLEEKKKYIKIQKEYNTIVNQFSVANLERPLDAINACLGSSKKRKKYKGVDAYPKEHAEEIAQLMDRDVGAVMFRAMQWQMLVGKRRTLLNNCIASIQMAMNVATIINKPAIIVCASIDVINIVLQYLPNSLPFHSKLPAKERNKNKDAFTKGEIKYLLVVKGLKMGYNKDDLEIMVRQGFTSKALDLIQFRGRLLRTDKNNSNKSVVLVHVYVDDFEYDGIKYKSQQRVWLQNALQGMSFVEWVDNINQIEI